MVYDHQLKVYTSCDRVSLTYVDVENLRGYNLAKATYM